MKKIVFIITLFSIGIIFNSCTDVDDTAVEPMLIVKFKFNPAQSRLNNLGQIAGVGSGNGAQTPVFNSISSHYMELAPDANTQLGDGQIIFKGQETSLGGSPAIDFSQAKIVSEGETFLQIPLKSIAPGSYEWMRSSVSYQNYSISVFHQGETYTGTLASFVGFNTYIDTFSIGNNIFPVNENKLQGYWAFALNDFPYSTSGQAPANATTVPNPISATSPIPLNSCVVTGKFATPLVITGLETKNIEITLSFSTNKSFEWHEVHFDGKFEPAIGENVVDMGIRGLIPTYNKL